MSAFHIGIALLFGTLLFPGVILGLRCDTTITGATWEYEYGVDEEIPGISTANKCANLCREDVFCRGYTLSTNGVVGYCYKFRNTKGLHGCENCFSGTMPESLEGVCAGSSDDVLAEGHSLYNVEECSQYCHYYMEGCVASTWFNTTIFDDPNCILYSKCDTQVPCNDCSTSKENCIPSLPPQCFEYFILNEERRNNEVEIYGSPNWCDKEGDTNQSPMWRGNGTYRFVEPAGLQIPENVPDDWYSCGVSLQGWINGRHPTELGQEVTLEACFGNGYEGYECSEKSNIRVTLCDGFYVYYLVDTPYCSMGYCGSD